MISNVLLREKIENVQMVAMDCDGCLTDGRIYMGRKGEVMKVFSVKDGQGIRILQARKIIIAIITGRQSSILANRAKELDISEIHQGVNDKAKKLGELVQKYNISFRNVAYIGDDINDLGAISAAGLSFAPADCSSVITSAVDIVLSSKGGEGAIRELVDIITAAPSTEIDSYENPQHRQYMKTSGYA